MADQIAGSGAVTANEATDPSAPVVSPSGTEAAPLATPPPAAETPLDYLALASSETPPANAPGADPAVPPAADPNADPNLDPEAARAQKGMIGEITELRAAKRELKAQLEAKETELAELKKAEANKPAMAGPGQNLQAALQQTEAARKSAHRLIGLLAVSPEKVQSELQSKGLTPRNEAGEEDWSPAAVYDFLNKAEEDLSAQSEQLLKTRDEITTTARANLQATLEVVPELKDGKSPEAALYRQVVQTNPWLLQHGNHPEIVAAFVLGKQLLEQRRTKPASNGGKPAVPAPTPAPPRLPGNGNASSGPGARTPADDMAAVRKKALAGDKESWVKLAGG